jgi:hypothetical protein
MYLRARYSYILCHFIKSRSKGIPVTGRGGLYVSEMLRIPRCLDIWLTGGGKVVTPTHRLHSTPQKHYFSASGTHFCYRLSKPQGLVWVEGLGKSKKFNSPHWVPPLTVNVSLKYWFYEAT